MTFGPLHALWTPSFKHSLLTLEMGPNAIEGRGQKHFLPNERPEHCAYKLSSQQCKLNISIQVGEQMNPDCDDVVILYS